MKQIVGIMTFEDPSCMAGSGIDSDVNMMMINNVIARWYGQKDANFKTRPSEMLKGSLHQLKGKCIQSAKYLSLGIVVDYSVANKSIVRVIHGVSALGCTQ